ncbi:MAG: hypothetical protein IPL61_01135 [Myxococcales bacterium]|nr:hypothetical protein [Myxococcales bacterium]
MQGRLAPVLVILVLISLVTAACVVRTRPAPRRGHAVHVHDGDDHAKHKKPKKHKDKHDD